MWWVAICASIIVIYVCIGGTHVVLSVLFDNNLLFVQLVVSRTFLHWFLHICIHFSSSFNPHFLSFLLGAGLLLSGFTHISPLVSPNRTFLSHRTGIMHPLWIWWYWKLVLLWRCLQFWCLYYLNNWWVWLLQKVLFCVVHSFRFWIWNIFTICDIFSYVYWDFLMWRIFFVVVAFRRGPDQDDPINFTL